MTNDRFILGIFAAVARVFGAWGQVAARRRCGGFLLAGHLALIPARALSAQGFLDDEKRTNGAETLGAVASIRSVAAEVTVGVGPEQAQPVAMGVLMSADGYVLTKATETQAMKSPRVWLPGGASEEARVVKRDERLDLALLKISKGGLAAVSWGESAPLRTGQWLCAMGGPGSGIRLGVFGANRRAIPNSGAVMGIRFAPADEGDIGVQIEEVATGGPADRAGIRAEDVLTEINGKKVNDPAEVKRIVSALKPGDLVEVGYKRAGKDGECEVRLASKNRVMMNWGGEDFANAGTSSRTDNFPAVIQHDMPLEAPDMGGAVFDLQGRAVAVNVARVDRVTNYALPVELFLSAVLQWMREDRERE